MFTIAFGLGTLVLENPAILQGLKWLGACFLLWLSWKIASARPNEAKAVRGYLGFWSAAAFQWVNPKMWLVCASAAGTYLQAGTGSAFEQSLYFGSLFLLAAFLGCSVWLGFGAASQRFLHTDRALRIFNVAIGTLLAGSVILFIL